MADREDAFARGVEIRSRVLGAEHVAANGGSAPDEMSPLHRLVTEFGWGSVWDRAELTPQQRSLITVAMLIALNRPHELRVHVRGGLRNGLTEDEVREVAVHAAPYCGFPAALDAMRVIDDVLAEAVTRTTADIGHDGDPPGTDI